MPTPSTVTVADDLAAAPPLLFAYYNATMVEMGGQPWATPDELPDFFRVDYDDPDGYYAAPGGYLVARLDGTPVGGVGYHLCGADMEVKRLYVAPEARGHRVARMLMDALHDRARAAGSPRCVLDVLPQRTTAIGLYKALGYRAIPPYRDDHGPIPLDCFAYDL
ncbi:GNAT family N-acetyltransferase [Yinghuangia seranimata]|uniref:GNAT family N-acetyltransferase n=1 Tax=Yinghuangia seranimata TaxID=408067 RepID=UPI00248B9851|nr:GNAT family N-acetyltransferase [Yinghuangia seranimata]MDI2130734.1 GNAT family N-acetyltransferase [Yinghuangia seranimata]